MENTDLGYFFNQGFVKHKMPEELFNNIKQECFKIRDDENGQPKDTHRLDNYRQDVENYFRDLVFYYQDQYNTQATDWPLDIDDPYLQNLWVNYQRKGEFNPPHTHTGAYSFNIWVSVPYYNQDEFNHNNSAYANKIRPGALSGSFMFQYTNILGELRDMYYEGDKSYEGYCFLFPAKLTHQVFPFYSSDELRITVSGNISQRKNNG